MERGQPQGGTGYEDAGYDEAHSWLDFAVVQGAAGVIGAGFLCCSLWRSYGRSRLWLGPEPERVAIRELEDGSRLEGVPGSLSMDDVTGVFTAFAMALPDRAPRSALLVTRLSDRIANANPVASCRGCPWRLCSD